MSRPKRRLLPFFLPMLGCPYQCVYCDQRAIAAAAAPSRKEIEAALSSFAPDGEAELAYYGGSFTCLPEQEQRAFLELARPYIERGVIGGVRVSTRPDAVDDKVCSFLRQQGVTTVELGVQSFDDEVLRQSGRHYGGSRAIRGCQAVSRSGLKLGIQLMTGLPGDEDELDISSMRQAAELSPALLRIYPTLVLEGTELARLYREGQYRPQGLQEAVAVCADMLEIAQAAAIPVQRMGLNPSPGLEQKLLAGPYHPAFGGLVREEVYLRRAVLALTEAIGGAGGEAGAKADGKAGAQTGAETGAEAGSEAATLRLRFHPHDLPLLYGQKKAGLQKLAARFPGLILEPDPSLPPGKPRVGQ